MTAKPGRVPRAVRTQIDVFYAGPPTPQQTAAVGSRGYLPHACATRTGSLAVGPWGLLLSQA
jgi:hypothetical protein